MIASAFPSNTASRQGQRPARARLGAVLAAAALGASTTALAEAPQYRAVDETPHGKAFVAQRHDAPSVSAALRLTLADAARYFGATPRVKSAYEDSRDGRSGGATFTVDAGGVRLNGLITCEVGHQGTRVAVVVIRADAPAGEWQRLVRADPSAPVGPGPGGPSSPGGAAAPAPGPAGIPPPAHLPLRRHEFEDRVASIGLAEGWTTPTREAMKGARIVGPAGQTLSIGLTATAQIPGSPLARMPGSLVAPFSTPLEALRALAPQFSRGSAAGGGPAFALDHLTSLGDQKASLPGGRASVLRYGTAERRRDGSEAHYQALAQVEIVPVGQTAFMTSITELRAPDASFERDLPLMLQMLQSVKYDQAQIQRQTNQNLAAQNQWFAAQQAGHRAQVAANDAQHQRYWQQQRDTAQRNKNWEDGQLAQARRDDNFSELMRGYRTVEDTQTGERRSADYLNVDKIVDDLNERDPGRYRAIPLRDENHPLDGK